MTRLTKTIKTDIKSLIRDKASKPKELALEAKKRESLLKAFWGQISKYNYQAWKTLPSAMYKTVTQDAYHLQVSDKALGQSQQSPTVHMPMVAIQTLDALVPLP